MRHRSTFAKPPPPVKEEQNDPPLSKEQLVAKLLNNSSFSIPSQQNLSLKNLFGKIHKPNTISNIPIATNQVKTPSSLLQCSEKIITFPSVGQTGCVTVLATDWLWSNGYRFGKEEQDKLCSVVVQHKHVITDFTCSQHLLATSSMDDTIRICSFTTDSESKQIQSSNQIDFSSTDYSTPVRVWFHPFAKNLFLSSHKDSSLRFFDLETQQSLFAFGSGEEKLFPKPVYSLAWNYSATILAVNCQDSSIRFVDPRNKLSIHDLELSFCSGAKPSQVIWCGNTPYVIQVGFSKQGERILSLIDSRKIDSSSTLAFTIVDRGSLPLQPFYDSSLHSLVVCGAGDSQIKFYEPVFSSNSFQLLTQYTTDTPTKSLATLPKSLVNVKEVEVNRFLRMTAQDTIEAMGIYVPRKQLNYFQEDLYQQIVDPKENEITIEEWKQSTVSNWKMLILKPEEMPSIFELQSVKQQQKEEEDREEDEEDDEEGQEESSTPQVVRKRRTTTMVRNDLKNIIKQSSFKQMPTTTVEQNSSQQEPSKPSASSTTESPAIVEEKPINSVKEARQRSASVAIQENHFDSKQEVEQVVVLEGYLEKKNPNFLGWKKRWFQVHSTDGVSYFESQSSTTLLGHISWNDILTVHSTQNKWKENTFVIKTQQRDYHLSSGFSKEQLQQWVNTLKLFVSEVRRQQQQQQQQSEIQKEGFLLKKNPHGSQWKQRYFIYDFKETILSYFVKKNTQALKKIPIQQVLHINDADELSFQIVTWNRVYELQASSQIEKQGWLQCLQLEWKKAHKNEESPQQPIMMVDETEEEQPQVEELKLENSKQEEVSIDSAKQEEIKVEDQLAKQEEESNCLQGYLLRYNAEHPQQIDKNFVMLDMETTHSLLFFKEESHCETYLHTKQEDVLLQSISLASIKSIELIHQPLQGISEEESKLYFGIKTSDDNLVFWGVPTQSMLQLWLDALQLVLDFYSAENIVSSATSTPSENLVEGLTSDIPTDLSKHKLYIEYTFLKSGQQQILYQVIGNKSALRVIPVKFHFSSLHSYHVYVLDYGTVIYQWNGKYSNRMERAKGLELCSTLKFKERAGNAKIILMEEANEEMQKELQHFYSLFTISAETSLRQEELPRQLIMEELDRSLVIYRVSTSKKRPITVLVKDCQSLPSHSILQPKSVYILVTKYELLIWNGKQSIMQQKKLAQQFAWKLLETSVTVTCVMKMTQGGEWILWKERFCDYPGMLPIQVSQATASTTTKQKQIKTIDVQQMVSSNYYSSLQYTHKKEEIDPTMQTVRITIWRVEDFEKVTVEKEWYGHFFSGESYLVLHSFTKQQSQIVYHVIYFWQGRECRQRDKGASTLLTVELDDSLENSSQIRVEQGKECLSFMTLFDKYIVHRGKWNDYKEWPSKTRFYQISSENESFCKTYEISCHASQLNSNHVYILNVEQKQMVWIGNYSNTVERQQGKLISQELLLSIDRQQIIQLEGQEVEEFWNYLGGKCQYAQHPLDTCLPVKQHTHSIRVFECQWMDGLEVTELMQPCQDDFYHPHFCFLIDAHFNFFVYLTTNANDKLKKATLRLAIEYTSKKKFTQGTWVIQQGKEPICFTSQIRGWNSSHTINAAINNRSRRTSTHTRLQQSLQQPPMESLEQIWKQYEIDKYTYNELLTDPLPVGVIDRQNLEQYLQDDEFEKVFQMKREEFIALPQWKQLKYKQKVYLY